MRKNKKCNSTTKRFFMDSSISYSELRSSLKAVMDKVCSEHATVQVKRRNGADVVIMSKEDYEAWDETAHLLSSPANAARLSAAIQRDSSKRRVYASMEEVENALGI